MQVQEIILSAAVIFVTQCCMAQFTDNFSDGDFTDNPAWSGDNSKFVISSGRLKLQAPAISDAAYLSTASQAIHNGSWEFYIEMDFTPSSANYAKVYLVSDQPGLNGALNGYFVKVGNTSREISLYRQIGTSEVKIIDGTDDRLNAALIRMKVKVTRNDSGMWQLFSDVGLTGSYSPEGVITDKTHTISSFLGIQCIYSSTRSDKFWFDDFVVSGIPVPDQTPPTIQSCVVLNQQQVALLFSEEIDKLSSESSSNYGIVPSESPVSASLQPDGKTVTLNFSTPLVNGVAYALRVSKVKDAAGNMMASIDVSILFFRPVLTKHKDIIFTEIFPDPSPQIGLPGAEFVEIYNRSTDPFDLTGWTFSDGSSTAALPKQIILPGEYWILTSTSSAVLFTSFGKTIGLTNFPTLNNNGDNLVLNDPRTGTIDSVSYSLEEYHDADKQEGGWSLELIDPSNPCGEQDNWTSSEDAKGGTPGKQNSVLASKPDLTGPLLLSAFPEASNRIALSFNEKLDAQSISVTDFTFRDPVGIKGVLFKDRSKRTVELHLKDTLKTRHTYWLDIGDIRDCNGNEGVKISTNFGLPEETDSLDMVINEILFNPRTGGADFLEVYNRSAKYLNLKNWKLFNFENNLPANLTSLSTADLLLPPDGYVVLSADPEMVKLQFPQSVEHNLRKVNLPGLPDDQGSAGIMNERSQVVDALTYSKQWHSPFIKDEEGVSLERISANSDTNSAGNWTSASSRAGYATPGFLNSQHMDGPEPMDGDVTIVPEVFSPAGDMNEFVEIRYNLVQPGWVVNVRIVDHQGHLLKTIANNETLGPKGFLQWDGDRDDGRRARAGYYVVWFEAFNSEGVVKTFRKRVVVAR